MSVGGLKSIIAPSLLASDFAKLGDEAKSMTDNGAEWLHLDVMDGHFVPNITIGAPVVKCLRKYTNAFLDCHIMVSEPEKWIKDFSDAKADQYCFHLEASDNPLRTVKLIKDSGMKAAVAVKPNTPIQKVDDLLDEVNMVLVMTVEPGFGGQSFMENMMPKVQYLRNKRPHLNIQVDGGLSPDTVKAAASNGANVIVAGTSIFKYPTKYKEIIHSLRQPVDDFIAKSKN